MFTSIYSW